MRARVSHGKPVSIYQAVDKKPAKRGLVAPVRLLVVTADQPRLVMELWETVKMLTNPAVLIWEVAPPVKVSVLPAPSVTVETEPTVAMVPVLPKSEETATVKPTWVAPATKLMVSLPPPKPKK